MLAWNVANFSVAAQAGKLKNFETYLKKQAKAQTPAQMMAALKALKAGGAAMEIREVQR